jgi:hypothetical protein
MALDFQTARFVEALREQQITTDGVRGVTPEQVCRQFWKEAYNIVTEVPLDLPKNILEGLAFTLEEHGVAVFMEM